MNEINTILTLLFIKISIGILLLRIFGTKRMTRWVIYSIIAFVFVTTVISDALVLAQCRPLHKLWNHTAQGSCWSPQVLINIGYFNGGKICNGLSYPNLTYLTDVQLLQFPQTGHYLLCQLSSCGIFR